MSPGPGSGLLKFNWLVSRNVPLFPTYPTSRALLAPNCARYLEVPVLDIGIDVLAIRLNRDYVIKRDSPKRERQVLDSGSWPQDSASD